MKTFAAAFPASNDVRRVSKPHMEKRRRDRINRSLETLRVLLLENRPACNEKLRNPKVEKAEILESVVDFLKTEMEVEKPHYSNRVLSASTEYQEELRSPCKNYQKYGEGMRSCLLRVGHFIATKSQELDTSTRYDVASSLNPQMGDSSVQTAHATEKLHRVLTTTSACYPNALSGQDLPMHHYPIGQVSHPHRVPARSESMQRTAPSHEDPDTGKHISPKPTTDMIDPVWRPWPQ